jgi:hypothetical protein
VDPTDSIFDALILHLPEGEVARLAGTLDRLIAARDEATAALEEDAPRESLGPALLKLRAARSVVLSLCPMLPQKWGYLQGMEGAPGPVPEREKANRDATAELGAFRNFVRGTVAPDDHTILSLGGRCYRIGASRPVTVTRRENDILLAFLRQPAMDKGQLAEVTGYAAEDAVKVLRELRRKYDGLFAPAIVMPGGRGQGGYHVAIRRPEPPVERTL